MSCVRVWCGAIPRTFYDPAYLVRNANNRAGNNLAGLVRDANHRAATDPADSMRNSNPRTADSPACLVWDANHRTADDLSGFEIHERLLDLLEIVELAHENVEINPATLQELHDLGK